MRTETAVLALLMLALTALCLWGAVRALARRPGRAPRGLAGAAAILGALFFGAWAFNLLTA